MSYRCWFINRSTVRAFAGTNGRLPDLLTQSLHLRSRTLQLHLTLPEGREETIAAKLGQTVQYTKAVLRERFDIDKQLTNRFEGQVLEHILIR